MTVSSQEQVVTVLSALTIFLYLLNKLLSAEGGAALAGLGARDVLRLWTVLVW